MMLAEPVNSPQGGGDYLALLPEEILLQIWMLLPEPQYMAEVCKRFHNLSRSSSLQAHWFISTHGRAYALFYALARPRLFKRELLHKLLQLGAVFSLQLVQQLKERRCKSDGSPAQLDTWGQHLSHDASEAVFEEGEKQYSRELCSSVCCGQSYAAWIAGDEKLPYDQLELFFGKLRFIPLPLFSCAGMMHLTLTTAVAKWPRAIFHFANHGIAFSDDEKRAILTEVLNGSEKGIQPFRTTAAVVADCETLLKMKTKHCSFVLDEALAAGVVSNLRHVELLEDESWRNDCIGQNASRSFEALIQIYWKGLLDFNLPALVTKVATQMANRLGSCDAMNVIHYLVHGNHKLIDGFAQFQWVAYWLTHQLTSLKLCCAPSKDQFILPKPKLISLSQQLDNVSDAIINVLMQPGLLDDTSVLQFALSQKIVVNWPSFLSRIIKCLLLVPMKGELLIAINNWVSKALRINFSEILSTEVERHAFPWHLGQPIGELYWSIECKALAGRAVEGQSASQPTERVITCCEEPQDWMVEDGEKFLNLKRYIDFGSEVDISCLPAKFRQKHQDELDLAEAVDAISESPLVKRLAAVPSQMRYVGHKKTTPLLSLASNQWRRNSYAIVNICGSGTMAQWIVGDHISLEWSLSGGKFLARRMARLDFFPPEYDPRRDKPTYRMQKGRRVRVPPPTLIPMGPDPFQML